MQLTLYRESCIIESENSKWAEGSVCYRLLLLVLNTSENAGGSAGMQIPLFSETGFPALVRPRSGQELRLPPEHPITGMAAGAMDRRIIRTEALR